MKRFALISVVFLFLLLPALCWAWGTLEVLNTGWTHVDTGGNLGVYTNALMDESAVTESAGAYHVKSFGSGYFGNFTVRWYGSRDGTWSDYSSCHFGFANEVDYWPGVVDAGDSLWVRVIRETTGPFAKIYTVNSGVETGSSAITIDTVSTNYYFQFSRSGTTATLTIWTGGYDDTLVGTVNLTCNATTYEYCHAYNVQSGNSGNVHWQIHDLDLSGPSGGPSVPSIQAGHRRRR